MTETKVPYVTRAKNKPRMAAGVLFDELPFQHLQDAEFVLRALSERVVAYNVVFARLADSAIAGLMLSQALYWQKRATIRGPDERLWFWKTQEEWHQELGVTRIEQETARKKLRALTGEDGRKIWNEERRGIGRRMYFYLDVGALADLLCALGAAHQDAEDPPSGEWKTDIPVSGKPTYRNVENRPTNTESSSESTTKKLRSNGAKPQLPQPQPQHRPTGALFDDEEER